MILNNKNDCADSIVTTLERTAFWRKTTAGKFPDDDKRNLAAALKLEQLAIEAVNLTDEQWTDLQGHFGWASQTWRDALVQAARMVGFSHKSGNFDSFIRLIVRQFPQRGVAA